MRGATVELSTMYLNDMGQAIQLALAPVFLLTGIAAMLGVIASRLARIIDRGRSLMEATGPKALAGEALARALGNLEHRRHLTSSAITACTLAALLVCTVIGALFIEVLLGLELGWFIGIAFTGTTLALIVGLAYFLREVHLATRTVRIQFSATSQSCAPPSTKEPAQPPKS